MSNLSEEEINILVILNDFANGKMERDKLEANIRDGGYKLGYLYTKDLQKAIFKFIDLYQQEKEKNFLLIEARTDVAQIEDYYVSKDKIRERIKELEELRDENADEINRNVRFYSIYDSYNLQINELQDLLLEEE